MTKYSLFLIVFFVSASFFLLNEIQKKPKADAVSVAFLDVGQGDATLIQKDNFQILIDGGPSDRVLSELGKEMSPLDRKIELIILTHPHADHLTGINQVIDRYEIGEIISTGVISSSSLYIQFLEKVKAKQIQLSVPVERSKRIFAESGELYFLWPGQKFISKESDNLNNSSLVSKVCYYSSCALFMGDLEEDGQKAMVNFYRSNGEESILKSNVIKVAHHGSNNALLPALYEVAQANYAVIQAGKDNQFGHPHKPVLDYFTGRGITILRTDQRGTIRFNLESGAIVLK